MGDRIFGTLYGAKSSLHLPVILNVFIDFDERNAVNLFESQILSFNAPLLFGKRSPLETKHENMYDPYIIF